MWDLNLLQFTRVSLVPGVMSGTATHFEGLHKVSISTPGEVVRKYLEGPQQHLPRCHHRENQLAECTNTGSCVQLEGIDAL